MKTTKTTIYGGILFLFLTMFFVGCTEGFEELNKNPYKITDKSLEQDYNDIGSYIPSVARAVVITTHWQYQIGQNLCSDSWAGYLAPPTPFAGGSNNTTYKMTWKDWTWKSSYRNIMAPSKVIIEKSEEKKKPQFEAWAKLIRIYGMQRVASLHGPIIYSEYGKSSSSVKYDSEEVLYTNFFKELDDIVKTLAEYKNFSGFKKFDVAYQGSVEKWLKLANSLRLKLAIRIANVKPDLAKTEAEKAYTNEFGLITSNEDNFNVDLGGEKHPLATICNSWGDTRMSATMESFLVGYQDPRIEKMFSPISDSDKQTLVPNHLNIPFKGVKNGATLVSKGLRTSYSKVGDFFETTTYHTLLNAAEVNFMLAEGKIRGWNVGNTARGYYEEGIKQSFAQWSASGVSEYIQNSINKPIDYIDPKAKTAKENAFSAQTDITIAWDEKDGADKKLEKIITQKWIAGYPDSYEAWSDFRRTGYPKIEPVYQNDSNDVDGVVSSNQHIQRMKFIQDEYDTNAQGVQDAIQKLGGDDKISTRLWWAK